MRKITLLQSFLLVLVAGGMTGGLCGSILGQITHLEVSASPTSLKAGFNTTVTITILNKFEPIYDMDVALSFPQSQITSVSPVVIGTSNLKFGKVNKGANVTLTPLIFVPEEAAGNGYQATVTITYKRLGYISPYTEVHTIGFYAQGQISVVIYDLLVEPEDATAGSPLTITGTLLNKGNIPALFTNATLLPHPLLTLIPESYSYLGEVDPNSPTPFTLETTVNPTAQEGNYTVKIQVEYEDKESRSYIIQKTASFHIIEAEETQPQGGPERIMEMIRERLLYIVIGVLVIIIIGVTVKLRRLSYKEFETGSLPT